MNTRVLTTMVGSGVRTRARLVSLTFFLFVELVVLAVLVPDFLSVGNLLNAAKASAVLGILAVGMTVVLISGLIDISIGSMVALTSVVAGQLLFIGYPAVVAVAGALGCGLLIGLANGLAVTRLNVSAIVVTLAALSWVRALSFIVTGALSRGITDRPFLILQEDLFGIPLPIVLMAFVFMLGAYLLHFTKTGRHVFAIGDDDDAARRVAIPVDRLVISVMAGSGFIAGLAGWVFASTSGAMIPTAGVGYELQVITAVVLGGASIAGGKGSLAGTLVGVLVISLMVNGLTLAGVPAYYQLLVQGSVFLVAVGLDARGSGGFR